ncbi:MAG: hypothetical protein ABSG17_11295 [Spirochaetia bacterium]|jgi:hypothetical protein
MSLKNDIRNLPPSRGETGSDVLAAVARREMEMRRENQEPGVRKQGHSLFGSDGGRKDGFEDYYGTGEEGDLQAGRNRDDHGGHMSVGRQFAEAADGYKPHIVVKAHSKFGPISRAMLETHPAKNDDSGAYAKFKDLYQREGKEAAMKFGETLTPEQVDYINSRLDEEERATAR